MAKEPIRIGDLVFPTKTAVLAYFSEMLNNYVDGQDVDVSDSVHLSNLIKRHPKAADKIGPGIKRFFKDKTRYPTSSFWIERTDGTTVHFALKKCVFKVK